MIRSSAYLDYNASAPLLDGARQAMTHALDAANPSSVHSAGRAARAIVEEARRSVAALVDGADAANVVFTSGASEAACTLLSPRWTFGRGEVLVSRLYVFATDHPCVLGGGRVGRDATTALPVDGDGIADLAALADALAAHDRAAGLPMVATHWANNETGVAQPVAEIARLARQAGGLCVVDAVQAAGRIPLGFMDGTVDALFLSAHKIGGPKGIGCFMLGSSLAAPAPLVAGGGQERGLRSGTENVPGIAGFGAAAVSARLALDHVASLGRMRDRFEAAVTRLAPDATIFGLAAERLANTTFFALPGMKAETLQIAFDLEGIAVSAGSACSSGKVGPSHVLKAMGHDAAAGAIRVSIGPGTTESELGLFEAALERIVARRSVGRRAA